MDISSLDTREASGKPVEIELLSPVSGNGVGIFMSVIGKDSDIVQQFSRDLIDDSLRKAQRAKKRGKEVEIQTSEKIQDRELDFLTLCTTAWRQTTNDDNGAEITKQTITCDGEEISFSKTNVKKLYKNFTWIATQVDDAVGDLSLFMKA